MAAWVAAAHEKGVLHRDLKPTTIMLDSRGLIILWISDSRDSPASFRGQRHQTRDTSLYAFTHASVAPEQLAGKEAPVRSDIYALGRVMYECSRGGGRLILFGLALVAGLAVYAFHTALGGRPLFKEDLFD